MGWESNMEKETGVRVGQQYVKVDSPRGTPPVWEPPVWEVNSIFSGVIADHAGLVNLDDPLYKKTVSFSALLDKTLYRLVSDVNAAA